MRRPAGTPLEIEEERAELEVLLASKMFLRAPSLGKLLGYLCHKYFDGEVDQIKEYTIAVELYGRAPDFHSKEDPIVRVEATRLRTRLKEYYHSEGRDHPLQILIPLGHYAPVFHRKHGGKVPGAGEEEPDAVPIKEAVPEHNGESVPAPAEVTASNGEAPHSEAAPGPPPRTGSRLPRALYLAAFFIAAIGLIVTAVVWWIRGPYRGMPRTPAQPAVSAGESTPAPAIPEGPEIRIMTGSTLERYVDRVGKVWESDRNYSGGEVLTASQATLQRAEISHLIKVARAGDFEYAIPLKPGIYEVHLFFAEMQYGFEPEEGGETSRLFNVYANDRLILEALDVFSDAGGGGKIDEKVFTDISPAQDGKLHLSFRSAKDKAILNGLAILPGIRGRMRPIRITTRTSPYLSQDQQLWEPDRYFRGGRSVVRLNAVENSSDPELYQSERYGNFTYTIPVAPGSYRLTLKFAETYFGPTHPQHVGPEKRLFDVYCNGQTLLKDFNIAREAGGLKRAVDKIFHRLQPNAQGKLVLSFVPVMNYACVNAIEVVPE